MRKEPDRTLLEESDDAKDACQSRNTCCEDEKISLPGILKKWVHVSLERLQVVLGVESPDRKLDDQLGETLDERLESGDVSHVVSPLLDPVRVAHKEAMCSGKGKILGPNLKNIIYCMNEQKIEKHSCGST